MNVCTKIDKRFLPYRAGVKAMGCLGSRPYISPSIFMKGFSDHHCVFVNSHRQVGVKPVKTDYTFINFRLCKTQNKKRINIVKSPSP